jgi:hypothetical protein
MYYDLNIAKGEGQCLMISNHREVVPANLLMHVFRGWRVGLAGWLYNAINSRKEN